MFMAFGRQTSYLKCPFCDKGEIMVTIFPASVKYKRGSWGGSKPGRIHTQESGMIRTKECPICHKTDKEMSKKFKELGIGDWE